MYADKTDNQLIQFYLDKQDQRAFETLVRRHYDTIRKRLLVHTKNKADADDLTQALWIKVLDYLPKYQDSDQFSHFINKIATNLLRDLWRKQGVRKESSLDQLEEDGQQFDGASQVTVLDQDPLQSGYAAKTELEYLTKSLIPQLPSHLRVVFLLKHESEYWDDRQPFQWQHLADLNNMDIDTVWNVFHSTRDKLVKNSHSRNERNDDISMDELQVFLVWTQAQRVDKKAKYTEQYFAGLLNIPVNTFKTHYRKAIQSLNEQMDEFQLGKN